MTVITAPSSNWELTDSDRRIDWNEVIQHLKGSFQLKELCQGILARQLVAETAESRGVVVTEAEVQAEINRWRHQNKLQKGSDALAWLADQMLTVQDLESAMRDRLLLAKLSQFLFEAEAKRLFMQNKSAFDQVLLYQIAVADHSLAKELFFQIEEQATSFFEAAQIYNLDPARRQNCGYEGLCDRRTLKPHIAAYVFNAPPDTVLPPVQTRQGYTIFYAKAFTPAQLSPELHQSLINELFQNWLTHELSRHRHRATP
jgi:parvulin-like peptidyl-prolyl isomerase